MCVFQAQERIPGQDTGLSLNTKDVVADDGSAAIEAVLVNTNQVIILIQSCQGLGKNSVDIFTASV